MKKKKLTLKKTKISKLNLTTLSRNLKGNIIGGDVVQPNTHPTPVIGTENASGQGYWQHASYDTQGNPIHSTECYYVCVS
ncbi:hypothetical protein [Chryseobacterium sp. OSA05B]|uniref:hypothetical protein n=1 Tax=Chryseobacterium sp. OSA05B TaxID=2862650 RepID=UPI001CBD9C5F|nr:hypothetical protein [Chryseobacterium sp. OSA05B]